MRRAAAALVALGLMAGAVGPARGAIILDFQDINIPGDTSVTFFTPYESQGFRLTANPPGNPNSSGFFARDRNAGLFYAGARGMATFSPAVGQPDNVIELTQINGQPFSLQSIDLARNFIFDPAPTVTFIGNLAGGGTVSQTFTVTTPVGVAAFQTFTFNPALFGNVVSVRWGQPPLTPNPPGPHQFTNITLDNAITAIPEPSTLALLTIGTAVAAGYGWRRRRRSRS